jgi:hypothetical protein
MPFNLNFNYSPTAINFNYSYPNLIFFFSYQIIINKPYRNILKQPFLFL